MKNNFEICKVCCKDNQIKDCIPFFTNIGYEGNHSKWYKCNNCNSFFISGNISYDRSITHHQKKEYGQVNRQCWYNRQRSPLYSYIISYFGKLNKNGGDLLDIGASFGGFLNLAKKHGFNCTAIEIVPKCIDILIKNGFRVMPSLSSLLPFEKQFDIITMLDVIYYYNNLYEEIKKVRKLLKQNGLLIIRTTNKHFLIRSSIFINKFFPSLGLYIFRRSVVDHLFVQKKNSLLEILRKCGFENIVVEPDITRNQSYKILEGGGSL